MRYSFNLMLGTRDDGTRTARMEITRDGMLEYSMSGEEPIQAFLGAVDEARDYFRDIGQQVHEWTRPSTAPTVFTSYEEEAAELAAWSKKP